MKIFKDLGRYYLGENEKQWHVKMKLPNGQWLSELWPEDEEPEIEGLPPSDVVERISEQLEKYLFKSNREETRKLIEWCRENAEELDRLWAETEIKRIRNELTKLTKQAEELQAMYLTNKSDKESEK